MYYTFPLGRVNILVDSHDKLMLTNSTYMTMYTRIRYAMYLRPE